ncbi:glycine/D-amino acid oxidase-like deaminating enzyme/nitrite reductase/ring-hydroxylating ferredoxin subunit [Paenibacillus endophyticus]|uniref:Glycine/D-amino acid oxidase-like deaminating enzyme/nitrite reductase/ring-hydroxylating ferredoxin subunit n=1 Tax=Paenibacillus endophyticus TaxID=1294268 RepID=A0A7W5G9H4_9BACL|nr:FAD-dependent oxidoreductase [Paenibacillus endophyticus]MBB3152169.1 glycine/D-amino acid oxidase-like deaminating enzyme/nitrite reductase/ring-hydroxylating ferredoxin subunit [Paenibacillus endophyticus]
MTSNQIPKFPQSLWMDSTEKLSIFPALDQNIETDITVVGGGISGITTAYLLIQEGFKVVLVEAGKLLGGTTAHTTAKITAQHDLIYDELIGQEGLEKAQLYYRANAEALQFIKRTIENANINCGFSAQEAYVYAESDAYIKKLEMEMLAYSRLGISGKYVESIPLQIPAKAAVIMHEQAQFHPLQYLSSLVDKFAEQGGIVYENTTAVDVEKGSEPEVITSQGYRIKCKHIVSCTHFPFYDGLGFYFARMHADRSYVLGLRVADHVAEGMYLSAGDPKRSMRSAESIEHGKLLLLGGQSHKTGQGVCTINHYEELKRYAENNFQIQEVVYRWSAQDLATGDQLPFIGRITAASPNVYIATGYRKWGMTNGTAAALLIRDLILNKENDYEGLYTPSRSKSAGTIKNLIVDNLDVAKHLIAGKLEMVNKRPEDLALDEGSVVRLHGKRAGAYKDSEGKLYLVDTTCTHMGCEVEWNNGDRTWDCPCHGSRFSVSGDVIEGPAEEPLIVLRS